MTFQFYDKEKWRRKMKKTYCLAIVWLCFLMMVALTACGQSSEKEILSGEQKNEAEMLKGYESVTIKTKDRTIQFNEMPKRVVTFDIHPAEIMLELGLEEYMVGTAANPDDILPKYREVYSKIPVLSRGLYPSKEAFLAVNPDFVYSGWDSTFQEDRIGTVDQLNELGIKAYSHQSSNIVGPTLEDVYQDIRKIGHIFKVEDRSEKLIESLNNSINDVRQRIERRIGTVEDPLRVFVYDSGEGVPFTATQTILTELIKMAGGKNIFDDIEKNWTTVTWEEVVQRNPEVIVIMDYGDTTVEQKKQVLFNKPALADVDAIKNKRIVVMPLDYTFEGVRIPIALEKLAKFFYPEVFK